MELIFNDAPERYVIGKNVLSESELCSIWNEIKFFSDPEKLHRPGIDHGARGLGGLTNSRAVHLEKVFARPEVSDILAAVTRVTTGIGGMAYEKWPDWIRAAHAEKFITKLRYYHDGDQYGTHSDWRHDFIFFLYLHTEPKSFTGGDLELSDYGIKIAPESNTCIFMPGRINHAVTKVAIPSADYWNGNGRYCISQFISIEPPTGYG